MRASEEKRRSSIWLRLMPYIMWLLPVLVLNLGFSFLADIELHWKEREQDETAQQELEALTRSSTVESRLNRLAGQITEQIETAARNKDDDRILDARLLNLGQSVFASVFPGFKLHVFKKSPGNKGFELFHVQSGRVESKRAMAIIFNHLVEQHKRVNITAEMRRQRDKIGESYFGRTLPSEAYAVSQRGRTSFVFHEQHPHWFIWDYHEGIGGFDWGYMVAAKTSDFSETAARETALNECRVRGNGLAGFLPVLDLTARPVLFRELEKSHLFNFWRATRVKSLLTDRPTFLEQGPPAPAQLGNFRIFSHLGKNTDYLTVFLSQKPVKAGLPLWVKILNVLTGSIWFLLVMRGLILGKWLEMQLTARFLMLYFLAATFPLGVLSTTAAAYQYQTGRSARNLIADNLEGCLRLIETRKMQIQEEYQKAARQLFQDEKLSKLIAEKSFEDNDVKDYIVHTFKNRATPLPLVGFYLLDVGGKGIEYTEEPSLHRLRDIFSVYRAPIIQNLRKRKLQAFPGLVLPEFKVSEEEQLGGTAFDSLSGNKFENEIERRRNFCIAQHSGDVSSTFIYDFIKVDGHPGAMLFIVWDGGSLFEQSISTAINNFKLSHPDFSFIAFTNTPQGLKTHFRLENDELTRQGFSESVKVAETAVARGGTVKTHMPGLSVAAMPFGMNSEIVIAGLGGHEKIRDAEAGRHTVFVLLMGVSLLIAAFCAYFTASFLLKPLTGLKTALNKVAEGDYSVNLDSSRPDELGRLTREFANMVEGLKERQRLSALLSDHAVEALSKSGGAREDGDSRVFKGIALVSDIRSFTTLCESYPTDEITDLLNHHFAAMAEAVASCGGHIYKFIGDAVEAVFEDEDEAVMAGNALKSAIGMNLALNKINSQRREKGLFTYAFGVGLAYGSFYAGSVGSEDTRLDFSIIGEAFARAAQLEASTKKLPDFPVIFDNETAELLRGQLKTMPVAGANEAFTFAPDDRFHLDAVSEITGAAVSPKKNSNEIEKTADHLPTNLARIFKFTAFTLSAVLAILTGLGVIAGFAWWNSLAGKFAGHRAVEGQFRLLSQLRSEDSHIVAFESQIKKAIDKMEKELRYEAQPNDQDSLRQSLDEAVQGFIELGVTPSRIMAASFAQEGDDNGRIILSHGLSAQGQDQFLMLARHMHLCCSGLEDPALAARLASHYDEMFADPVGANDITNERIGRASRVLNNKTPELLYWNFVRVLPDEMRDLPLPEENWQMANLDSSLQRVAAIIIFAVPESQVQKNFKLMVEGYSEPGARLAIRDEDGALYHAGNFPVEALDDDSGISEKSHFRISQAQTELEGRQCSVFVARLTPETHYVTTVSVSLVVVALVFLAVFAAYRSFFSQSFLNRSIQLKLILSVLLASMVPTLTVWFVAESFLFENHQALLSQQKMELLRYLDGFEPRQFYYQQVLTKIFAEFSANKEILACARELENNPAAEEPNARLQEIYAQAIDFVNANDDWSSNATARDIMLVSRNNWQISYAGKKRQAADTFARVLSMMGRHILNGVQPENRREKAGQNLKMLDVKNEIFFESAMRSIRSNFGDEPCIKFNSAFSKLVEFEITTGAAVMMATPIPSIQNPEFILIWVASLSRGGYVTRIARNNRGPVAVFTIEYQNYGEIVRKFRPFPGVDPAKAAAWITSSSLPVSFEQKVGNDRVSLEGRPGTQQNNNFLIAAASQRPIDQNTARLREYISYFMGLAIILFLIIGHQTASDIIIPVTALAKGMQQVDAQNYFYRIDLDRHDELGQLCDSYNRFARNLAEKEIMGKMLSKSARQAVGSGDAPVSGSRREFVFIFIGSLEFSDRLKSEDPRRLFALLKEQVTILCRIILEAGGDIDKLMGDKILGVFPAGGAVAIGARNAAIEAATKIVAAEKQGQIHFPVAIGINAGEVISGMLGFGAKRDFTVIGDAVNVSARIQKEAEKMPHDRCLYSESFVAGLSGQQGFVLHSKAALKGKSETVLLFRRPG